MSHDIMHDLERGFLEGYESYVASKLGENATPGVYMYLTEGFRAAQSLESDYDLGIELATDGLYLGYLFHLHGLPIKTVKLQREQDMASWEPLDLCKEDVYDKKIVIFDNDVVTGRTIDRAVFELEKFSPKYLDLLLMHETTLLDIDVWKDLNKKYDIPISETFPYEPTRIRETQEGLEVDYVDEFGFTRTNKIKSGSQNVAVNTRNNVPDNIRKIMTLQEDFKLQASDYLI